MEVRIPPEHIPERLVRDDNTSEKRPVRGLVVELTKYLVDQSGYFGEQSPIVAEERTQRLRHGEHELTMRQVEENIVGQMLGEKDGAFAAAGRAQVEAL